LADETDSKVLCFYFICLQTNKQMRLRSTLILFFYFAMLPNQKHGVAFREIFKSVKGFHKKKKSLKKM